MVKVFQERDPLHHCSVPGRETESKGQKRERFAQGQNAESYPVQAEVWGRHPGVPNSLVVFAFDKSCGVFVSRNLQALWDYFRLPSTSRPRVCPSPPIPTSAGQVGLGQVSAL